MRDRLAGECRIIHVKADRLDIVTDAFMTQWPAESEEWPGRGPGEEDAEISSAMANHGGPDGSPRLSQP